MDKAIYPGTFDPVTRGHEDLGTARLPAIRPGRGGGSDQQRQKALLHPGRAGGHGAASAGGLP